MMATGALEAALLRSGGSHILADVQAAVDQGLLQLWETEDSSIVTEILETPRQRVLNVFLAGGTQDGLEELAPTIRDWARAHGCGKAQFLGRPGFQRVPWLARSGWKPVGVMMETDL